MDFVLNMMLGYGLSTLVSFFLYMLFKDIIISKDNENEILNFYEKDLKSYKRLDHFFEERKYVQKPLSFSLIVGILLTFGYFMGMMINYSYIMYVENNPSGVPDDGKFNLNAYIIGFVFILFIRLKDFLKVKELLEHFEKVNSK